MTDFTEVNLPVKTYKRIVARKLSSNFRDTVIETFEFPQKIKSKQIIIQIVYAGVNASDINYTAGKYDPSAKAPLFPGKISSH